jgi:hypothetical protein
MLSLFLLAQEVQGQQQVDGVVQAGQARTVEMVVVAASQEVEQQRQH